VYFTASTIVALSDLASWTVRTARSSVTRRSAEPLSLLTPWISAVDSLWKRAHDGADGRILVQFWRDVSSAAGHGSVENLKSDPGVAAFTATMWDAARLTATTALRQGHLEILRSLAALLSGEGGEWKGILDHLRSVAESARSTIPEASLDWLAREAKEPSSRQLSAADESQSGALGYAAQALLAAWDARTEGSRSRVAYDAVQSMTQQLSKVDLVGTPGDVVKFDELQHELHGNPGPRPDSVRILRPGVRWSDGIRHRMVVRAIAEAV